MDRSEQICACITIAVLVMIICLVWMLRGVA